VTRVCEDATVDRELTSTTIPRRWSVGAYVALLLAIVAGVAAASSVYVAVQAERDARAEARRVSAYAAETAASQLATGLEVLRATVERLAANPQLPAVFQDPRGCTLSFAAAGAFQTGHLDILRRDGSVACSSRAPAGGKPLVGYRGEAWLREAAGGTTLRAPVRDRATGKQVVLAATPIRSGGVVAVFADLAPIGPELARLYGAGRPSIFLVASGDGRIVARSREPSRWLGRRLAETRFDADGTLGRDAEGRERIYGSAAVGETGWRVYVGEDEASTLAPGERLRNRQLAIIIVGFVVVLTAAFLVLRRVTSPIRRLEAAVRDADPYAVPPPRVPADGPGEVAALGDRVNELLGSIGGELQQRRYLEEQLRHAQKMDALGRVAAGIAHDFNNLVTVIGGFTSLMLRSVGRDDPLRTHVEEVNRATDRAASLIRQLLLFSRREPAQPTVLDANRLVTHMESLLRRVLGAHVELSAALRADPATVSADNGQLEQVLLNLAVNARDAMPDGGVLTLETANVTLDPVAADALSLGAGDYVVIRVADTGTGMDERTKARLFEPFFTTKPPDKGTGLGLATCYGIVTQFGGRIHVESELGAGSVFSIYLPLARGTAEVEAAAAEAPGPAGCGETILLVEDDPGLRTLARTVLEHGGYGVLEARFGEEALFVANSHDGPISLLLTDAVMPVMTGRELAARFRQLYPDATIVFMSGYDMDAAPDDLADGFLAKPFTPDELLDAVASALAARHGSASKDGELLRRE
jgi:signal transduction histidine kinase/ActR/RegA family two-component response regulator